VIKSSFLVISINYTVKDGQSRINKRTNKVGKDLPTNKASVNVLPSKEDTLPKVVDNVKVVNRPKKK
jgi:hypothetical protein